MSSVVVRMLEDGQFSTLKRLIYLDGDFKCVCFCSDDVPETGEDYGETGAWDLVSFWICGCDLLVYLCTSYHEFV